MLTLENNNLILEFDEADVGYSSFRLKPAYFNLGYMRPITPYSFLNKLTTDSEYIITSSDYYSLLVEGVEISVSGLSWTTVIASVLSSDLYGKEDVLGGTAVNVIKSVSTDALDIGLNRSINRHEVWYYFTPDGKGVIKKVFLTLNPSTNTIQVIKVLNFTGVNSVAPKLEALSYYFGKNQIGFDYTLLTDFTTDWTIDAGLTTTLGRKSVYPNLLPVFTDWTDLPSVYTATTLNLTPGDSTFISVFNAFPDNRRHFLRFETQNLTGTLRVSFSLTRNNRDTEANAQIVTYTNNAEQVIEFPAGLGYTWLYVRFEMLDGTSTVTNASVNYRDVVFPFTAPDESHLANTNLMGCIRVQSANPNAKQLYRILPSTLFIKDGFGVGISLLSLDNTNIIDGAFKIILQKPDNTWISSAVVNMFVDYNEKYKVVGAEQYNQWDDSIFGIDVPEGVDEIKAIGIEFTTTSPIDWLLDGFFILDWQGSDKGIGSDDRRNFGPGVDGLRARDFALRGTHGVTFPHDTTIKMERVVPDPGATSTPTFTNITSIVEVYYLAELTHSVQISATEDRGHECTVDMSGVSDYFYAISAKNGSTGETLRIKTAVGTDIVLDIAEKERNTNSDLIVITYKIKVDIPATGVWHYVTGGIKWESSASLYSAKLVGSVYADYIVDSRVDDPIGLLQASSTAELATMRVLRTEISLGPPLLSSYNNATLTDAANTKCETFYVLYPTKEKLGVVLYETAQRVQDLTNNLALQSRKEPLNPIPRNYNLIPHIAFGGEQIAADPIDYLTEAKGHLNEAGTTNAIVSAGSLSYFRDRDIENWWYWGGSLQDNGIDSLKATRDMLRSGLTETEISNYLSGCRYWFEVTTFAYEHNRRYRDQASVDYKNEEKFKRVWYYQESGGLYTSRTHAWDDFQESYYEDIEEGGKIYAFQYHYTLVIPAFWSIVTPKDDWSLSEDTIYDLMARRIGYLSDKYDCEGIIISELIHYREGFSDNDFTLFNAWCQANGFGAQSDWPRFGHQQYVDPDDESKIWPWKQYQVKQYLTEMATIAHDRGKLLGINVNVQNIISIVNQNNPAWSNFDTKFNSDYGTWHVNTLEKSINRYGTNYAELLKEDICDFLWVWLYYSYSPFEQQAVFDFLSFFNDYKERMILTIGLFPKENPPTECAIVALIRTLLAAGWNVCYAGYPPMLIQDERWENVWQQLKGYVPRVDWSAEDEEIIVDPARSVDVPFYMRF